MAHMTLASLRYTQVNCQVKANVIRINALHVRIEQDF